ncbi:hypothetical protein [Streptomyces sp. NPDC007100]
MIGAGTGVLSTGQQVGGSVGVAAVGVIFYGTLGDAPTTTPAPTPTP